MDSGSCGGRRTSLSQAGSKSALPLMGGASILPAGGHPLTSGRCCSPDLGDLSLRDSRCSKAQTHRLSTSFKRLSCNGSVGEQERPLGAQGGLCAIRPTATMCPLWLCLSSPSVQVMHVQQPQRNHWVSCGHEPQHPHHSKPCHCCSMAQPLHRLTENPLHLFCSWEAIHHCLYVFLKKCAFLCVFPSSYSTQHGLQYHVNFCVLQGALRIKTGIQFTR